MYNPNKYIVIPNKEIQIQSLCKQAEILTITEPIILTSREECILTYNNNVMKIGGTIDETKINITDYALDISFTKEETELLQKFIPLAPRVTPNFNSYKTSLEQMYNQLESMKSDKRILTATEIGYSIIKYAGWIALAILTTYLLNKTGIFQCISRCMPTHLCFKLCCNENRIDHSEPTRNIYTGSPIIPASTSTITENRPTYPSIEDTGSSTSSELEPLPEIIIKPRKTVRFVGTKSTLRRGV